MRPAPLTSDYALTLPGGFMNDKAPRGTAHSINGEELPDDPGDLFVVLYDLLSNEHFRARKPIGWRKNPTVRKLADRVRRDVLQDGYATPELAGSIIREYGDPGMFAVLMGLDWALGSVNPFSTCYDVPTMAWLSRRYARHNRLNSPGDEKETGLLLPRCTRPGKLLANPTNKPDYFDLRRVTPENCQGILHGRIPSRNDPVFSGGQAISVGTAPMLEKYADLQFDFHQDDGIGLYRIAPSTAALRDRIGNVIGNLGRSGAMIGVMPESTLSNELLDHWKQLLGQLPEESGLQWLLVGTGPVGIEDVDSDAPPPNRAVLVDCLTGRKVLEQDKMAGFTMGQGQATRWRLPGEPQDCLAVEDITRGRDIRVMESALGRIAVLICEDLKQSVVWEAKFQAFGVSHVFAPLFASPISRKPRDRWERVAAQRCVEEQGAWVVLSNSLAVGAEMEAQPPLEPDDCFNCAVVGPASRHPTQHGNYRTQFSRSTSVVELARVVYENDTPVTVAEGEQLPLPVVERGWAEL
jgi:predicted amidohydrolase